MKLLSVIVLLLILLSFTPTYAMRDGIRIEANGKPIDVEIGHLVPCVVDWNKDGKKDLIVGQFKEGKISLYLNKGTDSNPIFGNPTYLTAGGAVISLPYG